MTDTLRLGIAGLGTVGVGLLDAIARQASVIAGRCGRDIAISAVCARDRGKSRGDHDLSAFQWFGDPVALAAQGDIDVFVELIGGEEGPAKAAVEAALRRGLAAVTANKALLARQGTQLAQLAEKNAAALKFEAAIAGGIPVVKVMRETLAGDSVSRVFGILNGTCNYILTKMAQERREFDDVLQEAQKLGYAEADPAFDIGGVDAAHKLACLTSLAFGVQVDFDSIYVEGIEHITLEDIRNAGELGYSVKLLGVSLRTEDGIEQRVHPALVPGNAAIANVDGVFNAVAVDARFAGPLLMVGHGAGAHPTAASVLSDICDIARGNAVAPFGKPASQLAPYRRARMRAHEGGYYVALELFDRPGEVAAITHRLARQGISIQSMVQRQAAPADGASGGSSGLASFVVITHDTLESKMRAALDDIWRAGQASRKPRMIRIERL